MKILIVDDEKMIQTAIKNFGSKCGVDVEVACDGKEAVGLCEGGSDYDFILMDNLMHDVNGEQATKQIRALGHGSKYVIYLLTAHEDIDKEEIKKSGFDGVFIKPLIKSTFEELVAKHKK